MLVISYKAWYVPIHHASKILYSFFLLLPRRHHRELKQAGLNVSGKRTIGVFLVFIESGMVYCAFLVRLDPLLNPFRL